jgi:hypothetical protein
MLKGHWDLDGLAGLDVAACQDRLTAIATTAQTWRHEVNVSVVVDDPAVRVARLLDLIVAIYGAKLQVSCRALVGCLRDGNHFVYGMLGRSLLEHAAVLRYYAHEKILPIVDQAGSAVNLSDDQVAEIGDLLDRYLRGQRFDWSNLAAQLRAQGLAVPPQPQVSQINILTCFERWARHEPAVERLYALFCDLVHPNLGSNLLVLGVRDGQLVVGADDAEPLGGLIVASTLPALTAVAAAMGADLAGIHGRQRVVPRAD